LDIPIHVTFRPTTGKAVFVFVHGFGGHTSGSWGRFSESFLAEPQLSFWGSYGLGYASSIRVDVPGLWAADAGLDVLAQSLITALSVQAFDKCEVIGLAAHSMGGLVAQRALLDSPSLQARVRQLFLFGTPALGW
jgi:pimeloyl-ACP methyl ester carboxylesterase